MLKTFDIDAFNEDTQGYYSCYIDVLWLQETECTNDIFQNFRW